MRLKGVYLLRKEIKGIKYAWFLGDNGDLFVAILNFVDCDFEIYEGYIMDVMAVHFGEERKYYILRSIEKIK